MKTKGICAVALVLVLLVLMPALAQEEQKKEEDSEKEAPREIQKSQADEQARAIEKELVRIVQVLLAKAQRQGTTGDAQKTQQPTRAEAPEPVKHDKTALLSEIAEWRSKNLAMIEISKELKLTDLGGRYEQAKKKLEEKFKKREKIVVDPKRRPPGVREKEDEEIQKAYERELERLDKELEVEKRKIEKESEREAESIERLADELEKAILTGQSGEEDRHK